MNEAQPLWNPIWKLKVPEKIRTFLWTCAKGRLMTNKERFHRKFGNAPYCYRCKETQESIIHALRDCALPKNCWLKLVPPEARRTFFTMDLPQWIDFNLNNKINVSQDHMWHDIFATTCWWIWIWRNNLIFRNEPHPPDPVNFIKSQTEEFVKAWRLSNATRSNTTNMQRSNTWEPPAPGTLKLNIDGASRGNPGPASCGGVIRNENGDWIVGFSEVIGVCDALSAELWALRKGLLLAKQRVLNNLIVESDSLYVVKYIADGVTIGSASSPLVTSCQDLMKEFSNIEVVFCHRDCNRVADYLASYAFALPRRPQIFEEPPVACLSVVRADVPMNRL